MDQHLRILIVDDNEPLRDNLSEALSLAGYEVAVASDGLAALSLIESFQPTIILLDMRMPTMNGREFIAAYRELSFTMPIIGLSATKRGDDDVKDLDIADYLEKPFSLDDLFDSLRRFIK
jgi:two-component system, OmpR family, response regulator MprA